MIEKYRPTDFTEIYNIINDSASAYKEVIPSDCWDEPYMSEEELQTQIEQGVEFWCYREADLILGVMGIQDKSDVVLIRHAYVRTMSRSKGIGGKLLTQLIGQTEKPVLIGTWEAAAWAVKFYQNYGFRLLSKQEKDILLGRYWIIPKRQAEASVVLADSKWKSR